MSVDVDDERKEGTIMIQGLRAAGSILNFLGMLGNILGAVLTVVAFLG